jgi:adenylate kinase family enzyme
LEVIHLDQHFWQPGWVETPKDVWAEHVGALVRRDAWVMDGNYSGTLEARAEACDTLIFLDLPRTLCVWRVLKRVMFYRPGRRPDMAAGCHEHFNLDFLLWVWRYPQRTRPKVLALLRAHEASKRIVWLRSRAEVAAFLARAEGEPSARVASSLERRV